jgi:23S rRNA pseudouridine1911/1915/1917 synthase
LDRHRLLAEAPDEGLRLDGFLVMRLPELSRTYVATLVHNGRAFVDGKPVEKPSARLRAGNVVELEVPDPVEIEMAPEPMDLDVVFEDEHMVVLVKPAGLVVHPTPSSPGGTLVNALLAHCRENLSGISGELRPGIVHRLDKDTTGLLVVAKDDRTHIGLSAQLSARTMKRRYLALLWNSPPSSTGKVDAPIGRNPHERKSMGIVASGRRAVTNYRVLKRFEFACLVECRLETGRTHQIRVHMASLGCPVIADEKYGGMKPRRVASTRANRELIADVLRLAGHQMLHAETLSFTHPITGEDLEFNAAPPLEFRLTQKRLEKGLS